MSYRFVNTIVDENIKNTETNAFDLWQQSNEEPEKDSTGKSESSQESESDEPAEGVQNITEMIFKNDAEWETDELYFRNMIDNILEDIHSRMF